MISLDHQVPQEANMVERKECPSVFESMSPVKLRYIKGKQTKMFFYKILKEKKQISCYKEATSVKVNKKVKLKGAQIIHETVETPNDLKLLLKTGRVVVFDNLHPDQKQEIESLFETVETTLQVKKKKSALKSFTKGMMYVAKAPIKLGSGTIHVLEKISDGFKKTPGAIFKSERSKKKKKMPKGAAQGLYLGAESIVTEVFGAIAGLVTEPVKGGKKQGFKGVTTGIGKGIVGLIFKPVAGSIDLVTQTARGVGTVPKTLYKNLFKIKPRGSKEIIGGKDAEKENLQLVFESEQGAIYVNKEALANKVDLEPAKIGALSEDKDEEEKRKKLTEIMGVIINNLDDDTKNKHIEVLNDAIEEQPREEQGEDEEEDQEITKILNHYESQNMSEEDSEDDLLEIFYVKDPTIKRNSGWSMKTNSFNDEPHEKFVILKFEGDNGHDRSHSFSESYHSGYAVNKGIPIDDSMEIDVDEFKHDELKLDLFLATHTGRYGRNGPELRNSLDAFGTHKQISSPINNILELLGDEIDINVEPDFIPDRQSSKELSLIPLDRLHEKHGSYLSNKTFEKKPSNFSLVSKISIRPIDYNDMHQLIPNPKKVYKPLKKWQHPEVLADIVSRELEDLPDLIRITDYEPCVKVYNTLEGEELAEFLEKWKVHPEKDDVRFPHTHKSGGKQPENPIISKKMRAIGKDFIKKVGRTVLSGNFNLAAVPFPIKATIPRSYLENVGVTPSAYFPLYLNLAMRNQDPLERFKLYIVATIAYFFMTSPFSKPFNPIIGETYTGHYMDGGKVYLEQISHHPPVSYLLYYGPNEGYKMWGPTMFSASAGLNTMKLTTKGWRKILFADTNQLISNTFPNEAYDGVFWGTNTAETVGDMEFVDNENRIYCKLSFGTVKKKPSDYIEGKITVNDKVVSEISGTCLGWIEIDGQRYFDYRYSLPFEMVQEKSPLLSDFRYRKDYLYLKNGYLENAQKNKDELEQLQRQDGKLRKEHKEKIQKEEKKNKKK